MIDCGHNATMPWRPGQHLARLGVSKLDMLMITNYDEDHVSGLRDLEANVRVDWLVRNTSVSGSNLLSLKSDTGAGSNIKHLASRMHAFVPSQNPRPVFPGVTWNVYNNMFPEFDDENNLSMAVELTINDAKAFTRPYTFTRAFTLAPAWELQEYVCQAILDKVY